MFALIAGWIMLSGGGLFILHRLVKAGFGRPLGIKIICYLMSLWGNAYFLLGLILLYGKYVTVKETLFEFKGLSLLIYWVNTLGIPVVVLVLTLGLFYLRRWARILLIVLLGIWLLEGTGSLIYKKDFVGDYFRKFYEEGAEKFNKETQVDSDNIKDYSAKSHPSREKASFDLQKEIITSLFSLLIILYLFRKKTMEAFLKSGEYRIRWLRINKVILIVGALILLFFGGKAYQRLWIKFTRDPYLFTHPVKAKGIIRSDPSLLENFEEHQALGYRFYLPSGMKTRESSVSDSATVTFIEKNREGGLGVIITKRKGNCSDVIASFYARWNPHLLLLRPLPLRDSSAASKKSYALKEVKFEQKEGIMQSILHDDSKKIYSFILRIGEDDCIDCFIAGKEGDPFIDERRILNMIAAIKK